MNTADTISPFIYVGIKGAVMALHRTTGETIWKTHLKGGGFVSSLLDGDRVLAATQGEMFCLEPGSGKLLWHNKLPGMGLGLISIATANGTSSHPVAQRYKQDQEATTAS